MTIGPLVHRGCHAYVHPVPLRCIFLAGDRCSRSEGGASGSGAVVRPLTVILLLLPSQPSLPPSFHLHFFLLPHPLTRFLLFLPLPLLLLLLLLRLPRRRRQADDQPASLLHRHHSLLCAQ